LTKNLKVGDEVVAIFSWRPLGQRMQVLNVERVMSSHIELSDGTKWTHAGSPKKPYDHPTYEGAELHRSTKELLARVALETHLYDLRPLLVGLVEQISQSNPRLLELDLEDVEVLKDLLTELLTSR